jgi:hypothetical protein
MTTTRTTHLKDGLRPVKPRGGDAPAPEEEDRGASRVGGQPAKREMGEEE